MDSLLSGWPELSKREYTHSRKAHEEALTPRGVRAGTVDHKASSNVELCFASARTPSLPRLERMGGATLRDLDCSLSL